MPGPRRARAITSDSIFHSNVRKIEIAFAKDQQRFGAPLKSFQNQNTLDGGPLKSVILLKCPASVRFGWGHFRCFHRGSQNPTLVWCCCKISTLQASSTWQHSVHHNPSLRRRERRRKKRTFGFGLPIPARWCWYSTFAVGSIRDSFNAASRMVLSFIYCGRIFTVYWSKYVFQQSNRIIFI